MSRLLCLALFVALLSVGAAGAQSSGDILVVAATADGMVLTDLDLSCPKPLTGQRGGLVRVAPSGTAAAWNSGGDVVVADLRSGATHRIDGYDYVELGGWNSDGTRFGFLGSFNIVVVNVDGTGLTEWDAELGSVSAPEWVEDTVVFGHPGPGRGQLLAWDTVTEPVVVHEDVFATEVEAHDNGRIVMNDQGTLLAGSIDGGPLTTLASGASRNLGLSADGQQVAYGSYTGSTTEVSVVPASGGTSQLLTEGHVHEWLPDGRLSVATGEGDLRLIDPASLEETTLAVADAGFAVAPDGVAVGCPLDVREFTEATPIGAAAEASKMVWADDEADHVVVARADLFADALAGAALTGSGPLLFADGRDYLPAGSLIELERALPDHGLVYVLGGTAAISDALVDSIEDRGYDVVRLAGPTRVETAVAVARQVVSTFGTGSEVVVARADAPVGNPTAAWADSIAGGAYAAARQVPLVITQADGLHPAVDGLLNDLGTSSTLLLGGTAALSESVAADVPNAIRVAGADRTATAAALAALSPESDRAVLIDGFAGDGWAFGLGAATLAADTQAPLLMTNDGMIPTATREVLADCGRPDPIVYLTGGDDSRPAGLPDALRAARDC